MRAVTPTLRTTLTLGLCLAVSGCVPGFGSGGRQPAPVSVAVTSDLVTVTGPQGFCVDPTALNETGDSAFVLLGNCAAISSERRAPQPDVPAVLTATVSAPSEGGGLIDDPETLDAFVRSDEGRALLSRSGDPESVTILQTEPVGALFLLQARETGGSPIAGVQPTYWRAYIDLDERLATLTVLALDERPLADLESRALLMAFSGAVLTANGAATGVIDDTAAGTAQAQPATGTSPAGPAAFLRRIFR